ncbi:endonuclease VIII [Rathayibacter sp. AY1G1]|uniref:Fpg/Nei family DNA glycosylase n=1 Tax=unclassified Rathayibacter TaxID=2609250 RepID=UPI000CE7C131|nr:MULTISPECIES: DNA-formamidopyrimidine glycosylase family protein [unclassified Rathayibacter]PPF16761.1 endonuclease VIII [Rathayibacter sp. AY1A7]PPF29073.1 endonuclease VIII [Rathayibacter sp. AY1F2]PPH15379.1 endonuclease VIII [Rathayibacter sp. AY1G1]PPH36609.1 endonuclease VIII [Rathayibacter sp. AY1E3]PPH47992.1 endonuclease VIII [Rathayibacter sp. AY1F7]
MPELPEVQALALDLDARLGGRVLERLDVFAISALKTVAIPPSALSGETVHGVSRHGKFLDIAVGEAHVLLHLARAGWVRWRPERPTAPAKPGRGPLAARLVLDDGSGFDVTEAGTKKSLALSIVADPLDVPGVARLGPDPLDPEFTEEILGAILATAGRAQVKGVLRDQSRIAGIGNAYSDEILHVARMSPFKPAALTADELDRLYAALRYTLEEALARAEGLHAADLKREKKLGMRVHGRTGEACPVCGDTIRQVVFHDSTLQYCPTCQTDGRILADRLLSRLIK